MQNNNTRRGQTQTVVNNNCHSRESLSGISLIRIGKRPKQLLFNKQIIQKGDPRLQASGMTPNFIPPHPACGHPLPQGARETARGFTLMATYRLGVSPTGDERQPYNVCSGARKLSGSRLTYKCCKGFTLIELLVVVLIIAVLVAVALPQYNRAVKKAQGREVLTAIHALDQAQAAYWLENSSYNDLGSETDAEKFDIAIPEFKYFWHRNTSDFSRQFKQGGLSAQFIDGQLVIAGYYAMFSKENSSSSMKIIAEWWRGQLENVRCTPFDACIGYFDCTYQAPQTSTSYPGCQLKL